MSFVKKYAKFFIFVMCILCTTSCMLIPEVKFWIVSINLKADPNVNEGNTIMCNVVACYNDSIAEMFRDMTANEYFRQKNQLIKRYSEGFEIILDERIKPGLEKKGLIVKPKSYVKMKGLFFFAKLQKQTGGDFALALGKEPVITLHIKESEVTQYPGPIKDDHNKDCIPNYVPTRLQNNNNSTVACAA